MVKARAEKQNDSDAVHHWIHRVERPSMSLVAHPLFRFVCLQDEGDSYEDDTSDEDSDENSHTWFSLEKGSILTCNSSTMKAAITEAKKS